MKNVPRPYTLVAELTHRCPLSCLHCSNPRALVPKWREISTDDWLRVLDEAEALGVVQVHFSGGEPLLRLDLEALVARARALSLYVNLVTSGIPLERARLEKLVRAGLDHVQLSVQSAHILRGDRIAGKTGAHATKRKVLGWLRDLGVPFTLNVVLHRENLGEIDAIVALAERYGADRLELANTQYAGYARENLHALLPEAAALDAARERAAFHRTRLAGAMKIIFVKPDYFGDRPKACMDGWARSFVVLAPDGTVLPCHSASSIEGLEFWRIDAGSLPEIWARSPGFQAFRGEGWMKDPCRTCPERALDFGGCRCQAFSLTGDARNADPVCARSPHRAALEVEKERARVGSLQVLRRGRAVSGLPERLTFSPRR